MSHRSGSHNKIRKLCSLKICSGKNEKRYKIFNILGYHVQEGNINIYMKWDLNMRNVIIMISKELTVFNQIFFIFLMHVITSQL